MNAEIISLIEQEIDRLQQAKALLQKANTASNAIKSSYATKTLANPSLVPKRRAKHTISAEGRARIAAAQKARWKKVASQKKQDTASAAA